MRPRVVRLHGWMVHHVVLERRPSLVLAHVQGLRPGEEAVVEPREQVALEHHLKIRHLSSHGERPAAP